MIALEDCIGLCGLDEDEVAAISEHEHIPEMAAARIGELFADAASWRRNHPNHDHRRHSQSSRVASDTLRSCSWRCGISSNSTQKDALD